jgi:NAD(P)-dependent dehydrogenase (short-subunit alcohol dehydrogenase family)
MPFDLTDHTALVTGSSRGIGRAIAVSLAEAGATVAVHGRTKSDDLSTTTSIVQERNRNAVELVADLEDPAAARALIDETVQQLGHLDILINNAGILDPAPALDMTLASWSSVIAVNLTAPFILSQSAARHMKERGFGRIVNISSVAGRLVVSGYLQYSVAKAGLDQLSRQLAVELSPFGITVNTIAPAFVRTEMCEAAFRALPDLYEQQRARIPRHRMCEPAEVAAACLYLCSREADFTTGITLPVDGGYMAM